MRMNCIYLIKRGGNGRFPYPCLATVYHFPSAVIPVLNTLKHLSASFLPQKSHFKFNKCCTL